MVFVLNVQVYRHTAKNGGRNPQHRGTVQFRYCGRIVHDNSKDHLSRSAFVIAQSGFRYELAHLYNFCHAIFSRRRSPSQQGARLTPPCAMAGVECIVFVLIVQVYRQQTYCHKRRAGPSLWELCNSDTAGRVVQDNSNNHPSP